MIRIGTAGWSIPRQVAERFPDEGTGLARYAARFNCAEINSSFYRPHGRQTYERWAATVPADFRFAVKVPKAITHERRLAGAEDLLDTFLEGITPLEGKLGPLLVQLPPSLAFDAAVAEAFLRHLRERVVGPVALEPRHPTWFEADAEQLMLDQRIARVAADPAKVPAAGEPGGWGGLVYIRLHGSPRMYYSAYEPDYLARLAARLTADDWCIFDNTTSGAAAANALELCGLLAR